MVLVQAYRKLISDVREKAAFLSELDEEKTWTPFDVEKAVFAAEHSSSLSIDAVNTSLFDVKKEGPVTNNQTEEKHPADLRAKKSSSNFSKKRPHVAEKSGSESHETKGLGGEISTAVEGEKEAADLKAGKKQSAINPADTNPQPLRRSKRRRAAAR